jgi:hypothetical protein
MLDGLSTPSSLIFAHDMTQHFSEPAGFGFQIDAAHAGLVRDAIAAWRDVAGVDIIRPGLPGRCVRMVAWPRNGDPLTLVRLHRSFMALARTPRLSFDVLQGGLPVPAGRLTPG